MADNVAVTEGAGKTVATDDIQVDATHAQGQVQFVKLVDGTLNGTGSVRVNQAAKANALTVAPASDITDGTYIGDIKFGEAMYTEDIATPGAIVGFATMVERDDALGGLTPAEGDWASLRCDANGALWVHDNVVNTLLGTIDADTGAIKTAVELLDNAVDGNFLNVNLNFAGTDAQIGEGNISASTLRVTIATDDDGVAHLATIAGAVAATHMQCDIVAGTVTTVSTVTNLAQMGGPAITMDEGVHGTGVQRVTIATDDDGVLSLGIIDDWDATHDSAVSADGPQVMAAYDATKPAVVEDGDAVRILADQYGRLLAGVEPQSFQAVFDSANATAEGQVIHASAASTIIVVQSYVISVDVEGWIKLQDEASTTLTGKFWLKAGGGVAITLPDKAPIVLGVDKDLEVICEAAGNVSVSVTGYTIPG